VQNSSRRWKVPLVLVVEDHPTMSEVVRGLLTDVGDATRAVPSLGAARESSTAQGSPHSWASPSIPSISARPVQVAIDTGSRPVQPRH
jgi:CheY-like chemotaxis protein